MEAHNGMSAKIVEETGFKGDSNLLPTLCSSADTPIRGIGVFDPNLALALNLT